MYDVIVVGAGFAGAVFARKMAEAGKHVLVLDKRPHIGGNMYETCEPNGIRVHRYGPHIFHTNNRTVFEFLHRFSSWCSYEHRVLGHIDGQVVPIPINFKSIEMLFSTEDARHLIALLSAHFEFDSKVSVFDLLNHPNNDIVCFGQFVFDKVFAKYTAKQWGLPVEDVDKSTLNRVPVVMGYDCRYFSDPIQYMPQDGYTVLFQNMLSHTNIALDLGTNATECLSLDFDIHKILFKGQIFNGIVLFSGAVDELLSYRFGALSYRTLDMQFESHKKDFYQSSAVVNYPNEESFTRITEFKHLTGQVNPLHTVILKEYPRFFDHGQSLEPYYPINSPENNSLHQKYVDLLKPFKNILLCGRLAEYRYYNMDVVVANALRLAESVIIND